MSLEIRNKIEKNNLRFDDIKVFKTKVFKITYDISRASSSFNTWRNKYMPISEINLDKFNDIVEKLISFFPE